MMASCAPGLALPSCHLALLQDFSQRLGRYANEAPSTARDVGLIWLREGN